MPRPATPNVVIPTFTDHKRTPQGASAGHTVTVSADYAVWDETAGKFIDFADLKRQ